MKRSLILFLPLIFIFSLLLVSCGSTKTKRTTAIKQNELKKTQLVTDETTTIVAEHFGDTLRGVMPLPKLGKLPMRYTVSSGGATLKLEVTDSSLSYVAIPKHVGTTTTTTNKNTKENSSTKKDTDIKNDVMTVNRPWKPPIWLVLLLMGALYIAYQYFKNRLKPF